MMKVLAIQHDAADSPAVAGEIIAQLGHELSVIRMDRGEPLPEDSNADLLMTFGGDASFTRGVLPDWVAAEQAMIRSFVDSGRRVLGICFGSQMIASALGAKVRSNDEPEVGWHDVRKVDSATSPIADLFCEPVCALHWHRDRFEIPDGAQHILRSSACEHQGFVFDERVVGLQFHLEANERTVKTFARVSKWWQKLDTDFVQSESEILNGIEQHLPRQREVLSKLLHKLCS